MSGETVDVVAAELQTVSGFGTCREKATDILAALTRAGYAVVKLPEPQFYPDDERGDVIHFSGSSHSYFPEPGGRITDDSNSQVWESASDAKEDAAAILAAVSEVEK